MSDGDELLKLIREQYELALAGERPVYCSICRRPYRCYEVVDALLGWRIVYPYRHARVGSRELCSGSKAQARLMP